jgi:hypothetical protein
MDWFRRIRGAIGMGLTWAAGWMPVGALLGLTLTIIGLDPQGATQFWGAAKVFAVLGFLGGSIFGTVVGLAEGRRRFDQLSLPRFAMWGALGGLLLGVGGLQVLGGIRLHTFDMFAVGATTLLGMVSAAGTLMLARRAEDKRLLEAGDEIAAVGLTDQESRQLLGDSG